MQKDHKLSLSSIDYSISTREYESQGVIGTYFNGISNSISHLIKRTVSIIDKRCRGNG